MNATTAPDELIEEIKRVTDQHTAVIMLHKARKELASAIEELDITITDLRSEIVKVRPLGLLTVDEMGKAVGRNRNYIDSVWALHNRAQNAGGDDPDGSVQIHQTRVPVVDADPRVVRRVYNRLAVLADNQGRAVIRMSSARANRNRTVAVIYGSGILGPSTIADEVGIDRNHVLRLARRAGVPPMHRSGARNQYSK